LFGNIYSRSAVLKFWQVSESPGGLVITQISGPHPRDSDSGAVRGRVEEFEFLSNSQVMLMCLIRRLAVHSNDLEDD
jgi:hypothetical protein